MTARQVTDGIIADLIAGRPLKGIIPDPNNVGGYLCNAEGCGKPTGHYNYFVCWEHTGTCFRERRAMIEQRDLFDREFLASVKVANIWASEPPSKDVVGIEIVMSGAVVRHARELHAMRKRKPLMADERHGHGAGEIDLGEI